MKQASRLVLLTAIFCLLVSGAAGLVYQVVWMRYLSLFLGNTSYAVVAVLVAFMGGLALGNAWLGTRADRMRRLLAMYGWLEIGIAVYALLFPFYYDLCHQSYIGLARNLEPGRAGLLALKFLFSLLTILIPAVLMGGTLPVMTKLVTRSLGELRERVSTLYFINSLGAVLGCFLADFWLIPTVGLQATVSAGAAMNLSVGAIALFVSSWINEGKELPPEEVKEPAANEDEVFTPGELKLAVVAIGVSGFVAMLYEVVWTRMLALALGSSTHAFSIMLITFITGIAFGAWVVGRWKKLRRTMEAFAGAELALALALLASMFFYDQLPYWFIKIADKLARRPDAYLLYEMTQGLICFTVMFVPTACLGMTLPLVSRIATAELGRTGRSVGMVFSVNTLGTVLGAAVTGLWLMPWLGLARTLALGIALNLAIGLVVLLRKQTGWRPLIVVAVPLVAVAIVVMAGRLFDDTWRRAFTMGLWREPAAADLKAYRDRVNAVTLRYYRDGAGSTVNVEAVLTGTNENLALRVNGKPEASTISDVPTQLLLGHIPLLLRPETKRALVIGLGSGMTCGAVLNHPSVERLDAVEISPEVAEAARLFAAHNGKVLDNPRFRLVMDDAKSFLQMSSERYDVIISEPSNPWMAGVAGVFTREYYENCRRRLNTNGVMTQWVQAYETDDRVLEIVLSTFSSVFPRMSVWQGGVGDLILVGSAQALNIDFGALQKRFYEPTVKADMARIDLFRVSVLLAQEIISPHYASFVPGPEALVHSDLYPVLDYVSQRAFFVREGATLQKIFDENFSTRGTTLFAQYLEEQRLDENDLKAFTLFQTANRMGSGRFFHSLLKRWEADFPRAIAPIEISAKWPEASPAAPLQVQQMGRFRQELFDTAAKDPDLLRLYAQFLFRTYRLERSILYTPPDTELRSVLNRLIETDPPNQRVYRLQLAELAWDRRDDAACLQLARDGFDAQTNRFGPIKFDVDPQAPARVLAHLIDTAWRDGRYQDAWDLCRQAKERGHTGNNDIRTYPILEMLCRKVGIFMNQPIQSRPN